MPRSARQISSSNVYHIMTRGINRQSIFEDEEDCLKYLALVRKAKSEFSCKVHAWCLMGNHVHLLMEFGNEGPSVVMRKINAIYAMYYNEKNGRIGPVFADRFKSEVVQNDRYFVTAARYIHRNPVKAGICLAPDEYRWSSYLDYCEACGIDCMYVPEPSVTDIEFLLEMQGGRGLIEFTNVDNDDEHLDVSDDRRRKFSDEKARKIMIDMLSCGSVAEFDALEPDAKLHGIRKLRSLGIGISQISRLTGIDKAKIYRLTQS